MDNKKHEQTQKKTAGMAPLQRFVMFRGQLFSGKWIYGFYAVIPTDGHLTDYIFDGRWHEVVHGSVGQFTGETDKKGVKIFEDDCYFWDAGRGESEKGQIVFSDASFKCFTGPKKRNYDLHSMKLNIEVTGNIHDDVKSGI